MIDLEFNKRISNLLAEQLAAGYESTPDGLLSPEEIKESGLIKRFGEWLIPTEWFISEFKIGTIKRGEKFLVVSPQYLQWREKRKTSKTPEDYIEAEIAKEKEPVIGHLKENLSNLNF